MSSLRRGLEGMLRVSARVLSRPQKRTWSQTVVGVSGGRGPLALGAGHYGVLEDSRIAAG